MGSEISTTKHVQYTIVTIPRPPELSSSKFIHTTTRQLREMPMTLNRGNHANEKS